MRLIAFVMPDLRYCTVGLSLGCFLLVATCCDAEVFYVSKDGRDDPARKGRHAGDAWASLAYACERVPAGPHTIELAAGTYQANRVARPAAGITIRGAGRTGKQITRLVAANDWKLSAEPSRGKLVDEYLIAVEKADHVTIRGMILESDPKHRITGAVFADGAHHLKMADVTAREFRWNGMRFQFCHHLQVQHCRLVNCSTDKSRFHGGNISTRWIKNSEIHHCVIDSRVGGGYGYKGGGHENVKIHHNHFDVNGGFAIESAHENEFGVEIFHNFANRCFSIPKGGQGADPKTRGYDYSFWIHHNLLTDSYTVEGPRNHLRFNHNYVRIEKPNGRVYTHHGGINHGPVWIHHNVIENVDRAFVWMNRGLAENIYVFNNTVFCADAKERTGQLLGAYSGDRLNQWVIVNNVFVAPKNRPRKLLPLQRGVPEKMKIRSNFCLHCEEVPAGNISGEQLGFLAKGAKPTPYYRPKKDSLLVNAGIAIDLPFAADTTTIGALSADGGWDLSEIPGKDVDSQQSRPATKKKTSSSDSR